VTDTYELFAIRYASNPRRTRSENVIFERSDPAHDPRMPMDFFVWLAVGRQRVVLIDSGADEQTCRARGHDFHCSPVRGLAAVGIGADDVGDIISTHLHWDHAGNVEHFPDARFHVQRAEMAHVTGPLMGEPYFRRPYEPEQIVSYLKNVFDQRVTFHDGEAEIVHGIAVRHVGGHTPGMQVVTVRTDRGTVVLASDTIHYYENFQSRNPFPILVDVVDYIDAWRTVQTLADDREAIVPGHDPDVMRRYPPLDAETAGLVARLDRHPSTDGAEPDGTGW
jgi:glyoxylase-like metal-dependent hydrolase (beta-lactamase superfamily II)